MTVAGQAFSVSGEGDLPVNVAAGGTYSFSVKFSPAAMGATTGQLTISSNSTVNGTLLIGLSGTGTSASSTNSTSLSALSCASGSMTGAGTDSCTVMLNAAAANGGLTVALASNNSAVTVPASVTVASGATSTSFTANVSSVSTTQTATLTASAGGVAETFAMQLNASSQSSTGAPALSAFDCISDSMMGAGTDNCTVTLSGAAPNGGFAVSLSSNNSAVIVPATVTVASGATSTSFTANVSSVSTTQTATLTASADGISEGFALQLDAVVVAVPALSVNTTSLDFGIVGVNTTATQSLTLSSTGTAAVTVSAATVTGTGFTVSGASFPLTLNPNQTAALIVQFDPTTAGTATGSLAFASNSSTGSSTVVSLSGNGVPLLSALSCTIGSMTGAGTDNCSVMLNAAAPNGGFAVSLSSSNSAVTVPATVTVPAGLNNASFAATVSPVSTAQSVTLIATAGGISQSFALQLNVDNVGLSISATSVAFGSVPVTTIATQSVNLTASGTLPITVAAATVVGAGFSISGATFPLTMTNGQVATLEIAFNPTTAGATTGQLAILSTSLTNGVAVINLSGTGEPILVSLSWDAPTSSADPVTGYNVFRSPTGAGNYQQLNSSVVTQTTYADTTVQIGQSYDYIVESVDASGIESVPSNMASVTIP